MGQAGAQKSIALSIGLGPVITQSSTEHQRLGVGVERFHRRTDAFTHARCQRKAASPRFDVGHRIDVELPGQVSGAVPPGRMLEAAGPSADPQGVANLQPGHLAGGGALDAGEQSAAPEGNHHLDASEEWAGIAAQHRRALHPPRPQVVERVERTNR